MATENVLRSFREEVSELVETLQEEGCRKDDIVTVLDEVLERVSGGPRFTIDRMENVEIDRESGEGTATIVLSCCTPVPRIDLDAPCSDGCELYAEFRSGRREKGHSGENLDGEIQELWVLNNGCILRAEVPTAENY